MSNARLDQLTRESYVQDSMVNARVDQLAREAWVSLDVIAVNGLWREAWIPVSADAGRCQPPDAYYLSLITSLYRTRPNFMGWLESVLSIICDINACVRSIDANFDIDLAVGIQLDLLGTIIGVGRTVPFQPTGGVSPVLDDATYRVLLRARIAQNQWDGQLSSLYAIWTGLFPGGTIAVQDNQNMTATIFLSGITSSIIQDLIVNGMIVPRPEGVLYNYVVSQLPAFGFDGDHVYIAGFGEGHWA